MIKDVTYRRPEYVAALDRWRLVRDVCKGSDAIKAGKTLYLPQPNPDDKSAANTERYKDYIKRAVFFNATGRTKNGLVGAVFRTVPTFTAPTTLAYLTEDADGAGVSIYQQSQMVLADVLETGRSFLLVDFPNVVKADGSSDSSVRDLQEGGVQATIKAYPAESVINWRTTKVGAKHLLSLVVLVETHEVEGDFEVETWPQYRVLRLVYGSYLVEVWRQDEKGGDFGLKEQYIPTRGNGQNWNEIPGGFVGSQNNDTSPDDAPLYDMAEVNVGHYRNSADYEDSVYMVGQPQIYMAGLDQQWVDMLEKKGIYFGSRAPLMLPQGGTAGILQVEPNSMAKEAMDGKTADMVALGARLIEQGSATKTATQAGADNAAEHSVLSLVASNVSEAYTKALLFASDFMGVTGTCEYKLNQDFVEATVDAQVLSELLKAVQAGQMPASDFWRELRRLGLIDAEKSDDDIRGELETSSTGLALGGE
jgi:hypothetical protein